MYNILVNSTMKTNAPRPAQLIQSIIDIMQLETILFLQERFDLRLHWSSEHTTTRFMYQVLFTLSTFA